MSVLSIVIKAVISFLIAYAIGCFSSAYFVGWIKKIDIREHGSGNAGTTNVMRVLGRGAGLVVLFIDVFKGFLATLIGFYIFRYSVDVAHAAEFSRYGIYISGLGAVMGHNWPVNLGFRGGKGVATTLGIFLIPEPVVALSMFGLFIITNAISKLVSLSAILAILLFSAITIPLRLYTVDMSVTEQYIFVAYVIIINFIVLYGHRSNITRLFKGVESKTDLINIITNTNKKED